LSDEAIDRINEAIAAHVLSEQRVFMSSTRVNGRFTLRFIALASRTHRRHADMAIVALERAVAIITTNIDSYLHCPPHPSVATSAALVTA